MVKIQPLGHMSPIQPSHAIVLITMTKPSSDVLTMLYQVPLCC